MYRLSSQIITTNLMNTNQKPNPNSVLLSSHCIQLNVELFNNIYFDLEKKVHELNTFSV